MTERQFMKSIQHLNQVEILSGAVSTLNRLLVDKGVVTDKELQEKFLDWMRRSGLEDKGGAQKSGLIGRKKRVFR